MDLGEESKVLGKWVIRLVRQSVIKSVNEVSFVKEWHEELCDGFRL